MVAERRFEHDEADVSLSVDWTTQGGDSSGEPDTVWFLLGFLDQCRSEGRRPEHATSYR